MNAVPPWLCPAFARHEDPAAKADAHADIDHPKDDHTHDQRRHRRVAAGMLGNGES
jgi:hypothetical protein